MTSLALDAIVLATGWAHVILAPYSKVEESFNLHATHDVLMYGVGVDTLYNYDHFTFPGAVPRTFVGSVLLAWLATPVLHLAAWLGLLTSKFDIQLIIRLVLSSMNALTLCLIKRGVSRRFGRITGIFFALLTCSQFHYPFWMGRTIPNMFATIPVNLAIWLIVDRPPHSKRPSTRSLATAVSFLTFTAVVFRAEVALLLGPLCLQLLLSRRLSLPELIQVGAMTSFVSIALTVSVDSYFWDNYFIWPEFRSIYFNVVEGKSSEWGTSPIHTYITSYLPKLLLGSLPLSIFGFLTDKRIRSLMLSSLLFIGIISNLGHKEWRFIVYVIPLFNIAGAKGAAWMASRRKGRVIGRIFSLIPVGFIAINAAFSLLSTIASIHNYPGGEALFAIHQIYPVNSSDFLNSSPLNIHISNLAAQTGASLFLHLNAPPFQFISLAPHTSQSQWIYNKTENLSLQALASSPTFTHLISEVPPSADSQLERHFYTISTIRGFDRWVVDWEFLKGLRNVPVVKPLKGIKGLLKYASSDKLWILERKPLTSVPRT